MKEKKTKKFNFRLPKLTPLNLILMIMIPILLFLIIAIPVLYVNEYNANKVTPFASEIENINKKEIVYGNKDTIKDFNFILYCTDYNNTTGTVKFTAYIYENDKTRDLITSASKVNVRLGMFSNWIKTEKTSSNYSKYIATGPRNAKDNSRSRFDFTINGVPTLPQKGKLPFINIKTIPVYAFVSYPVTINGTETTKYYILKYNYSDYVIGSKSMVDTRDKELNVSSSYVQWRYKNDTSWTNSVSKEDLIGVEVRTTDDYIQWKRKCDTNWNNLKPFSELNNYSTDKTVEVNVSNSYVRWKYSEDTAWNSLVSTTTFTSTVDTRVNDGYIQWKRYRTDTDYTNLIAITDLENYTEDKTVEVRVSGSNIEWKYSGGDYKILQSIESLIGIEVRFSNDIVQWKCADETEWRNLLKNGEFVTKGSLDTPIKYGPTSGGIE